MIRYIIHLKVEYYEPKTKEMKSDIAAGVQTNADASVEIFKKQITELMKTKDVALVEKEFKGQTFGTAIYLDLLEEKLENILGALRVIDVVDIIEPEIYESLRCLK
jgi:hypothetical protein